MTDVLIALGLGGFAFWVFTWVRTKLADEALDAEFQSTLCEARAKLPSEDFERLSAQLIELRTGVLQAAATNGLNGKQATRMGKTAAIQSINAFIEIDRMLTAKPQAA